MISRYTNANRRAWDQAAPHHRSIDGYQKRLDGFARQGISCLAAEETERLAAIGVVGKSVAQHPINNMLEPGDPDPHRLANSYFRREPFVENRIIVYEGEGKEQGETAQLPLSYSPTARKSLGR